MEEDGCSTGMNVKRWIGLSLAGVLLACPLCAQYSTRALAQYSERLFRTEDGLPQNEIRSIAQTQDGYLWFGTRDGLARFDGVRFTVFSAETTPGLGHNMFGSMLVDHLGRLWIATADGLSCYEGGKFRRYGERDGLPASAVHSVLEDGAGKLWVGTWNGLAVFDGMRFRSVSNQGGMPAQSISGLTGDGRGGLWIGSYGGGLVHMAQGRFQVFGEKDGLPSNVIETVLLDRSGRLWVGTLHGSALLTASGRFETLREIPGRSICLVEDSSGSIWTATDKVFARLRKEPGAAFHAEAGPAANIESVFEDREGSIWVGTFASGVARYRAGPFVSYSKREGLAGNRVETVFEDSKANLWIGTSDGLSRWSEGTLHPVAPDHFPAGVDVNSIAEDDSGRIWVGTAKGIARFDGHTWTQLGVRENIPTDVHTLYKDSKGRIWIGSPEGITIWDHDRVSKITQRDGLPGNYVMSILEDRQGRFWVGTITALACLDHGKITAYTKPDGLLSTYIQCLYEDAQGTLWICTPSGLHRFRNGHFQPFTVKDGMFSDSTLRVMEDDQQRLWISSYRGIFRVDKNALNAFADGRRTHIEAVSYGTEDGMKSNVCSGFGRQPAGWRTHDGMLWFPTEDGVVSVNPAQLPAPHPPPEPVIEAVLREGTVSPGEKMGPDVHRIDFRFTAPTSIRPEGIEFRYRMQGYENRWRSAGRERVISFTNLPHGSYRFAVSARRGNGSWSAEEAASTIEILPHFYQTSWFYAGAVFLTMLLIWLAHSLRLRQTERRLQAVMAERARVAQELHDTLLQSLAGTAMQIQAALRRFHRGASEIALQQLSNALVHLGIGMADARQAIWDLKSPELLDHRLDRALQAASQRVCAGGPRLNFVVSGTPKPAAQRLEKHIYRIGVEAIANAVLHSGCSDIAVELEFHSNSIRLRVRDNGCGFGPGEEEPPTFSNHWGLTGMRERAKQCSGRFTIDSAPGAGTEVRFEAPFLPQA